MSLLGLFILALVAYPVVLEEAVRRVGVRGVAGGALSLSLLVSLMTRDRAGPMPQFGTVGKAGLVVLLLLAFATDDPVHLRLIVAVVYLALASVFMRSLGREVSVIETLVRTLQPAAPEFIRPYCRKLTAIWGGFFFINAGVLALLALTAPLATWTLYSGRIVHAEMGILFVVDFFVRKTWFRYYFDMGPFDRLWSTLFPAENTVAGRRSAEYIRRVKES